MVDRLGAVRVVCYSPDVFPDILWVVVVKVVLSAPFVSVFCRQGALFQYFQEPATSQPIT